MIKVGLTGNIGTGKSTMAKVFETLGVPVYHADAEAKKFLEYPEVIEEIIGLFGERVHDSDGIDKRKLASIVFSNSELLHKLNAIIHPLVKIDLNEWFKRNASYPYLIQEAAILFESGFYKDFAKIVLVHSPPELSTKRVMTRDQVNMAEVERRRKNQWDQNQKKELSDFIIYNDEKKLVIPQVLKIHYALLEFSAKQN